MTTFKRGYSPKLLPLLYGAFSLFITHGGATAADKIRIAYSALAPTQGVLWVAETAGLFAQNGLIADTIYTRAAIETLVAGEVQFGQMTGALMFSARLQGADPVMLAGVQDILNDRLVVRPGINSVEELKGKRVGVFRFGSASHMRLLNVLPRYGLTERDVTFLQVGDTPERLICALLPDVLVKGGDYRPEQIAGGDCVRRAGGEVRVLGFVDGHSTTALIERIRAGR